MKHELLPVLIVLCFAGGCRSETPLNHGTQRHTAVVARAPEFVVLPNSTNAIQFRLYTNAAPDAVHLFNTFEVDAYGETLLASPALNETARKAASAISGASLQNILVNGKGPELASTNGSALIDTLSGPDWSYVAFDVTPAYRDRLEQFHRAIVFVAPDLFVLYDHLIAKSPASFQMRLHPPAATKVDSVWADLRMETPAAGMTVHAPSTRHTLRSWERVESPADQLLSGTVTMQLRPTNQLAELRLLTVFAVHRAGENKGFTFKLLESQNAIGARILRAGLPSLVAFKTDTSSSGASLTGFPFKGPVGVAVFKPKQQSTPGAK